MRLTKMSDHGLDSGKRPKPKRRFSHAGFFDKLTCHKTDEGHRTSEGHAVLSASNEAGEPSVEEKPPRNLGEGGEVDRRIAREGERKTETRKDGQKKFRRYSVSSFFNRLSGGNSSPSNSPPPSSGPSSLHTDLSSITDSGTISGAASTSGISQQSKPEGKTRRKSVAVSVAGLIRIDEEDLRTLRPRSLSRPSFQPQSVATVQHTVGENETMESLAAQHDVTAAYLRSLNKTMSSWIVPGQTLLLPKREDTPGDNKAESTEDVSRKNRRRASSVRALEQEIENKSNPKPYNRVRHQSVIDAPILGSAVYLKAEHYNYDLQKSVAGALLLSQESAQFESVAGKCKSDQINKVITKSANISASIGSTVTKSATDAEVLDANTDAGADITNTDSSSLSDSATAVANIARAIATSGVASIANAEATKAPATASAAAVDSNAASVPSQIYTLEVPLRLVTFVKIFVSTRKLSEAKQPCLYCSKDIEPVKKFFTDGDSDTYSSRYASDNEKDYDEVIDSMLQNITIPEVSSQVNAVQENASGKYFQQASDQPKKSQMDFRVSSSRRRIGIDHSVTSGLNPDSILTDSLKSALIELKAGEKQLSSANTDSVSSKFCGNTNGIDFETLRVDCAGTNIKSGPVSASSSETLVPSDGSSLENDSYAINDGLIPLPLESIILNHQRMQTDLSPSGYFDATEHNDDNRNSDNCELTTQESFVESFTTVSFYKDDVRDDGLTKIERDKYEVNSANSVLREIGERSDVFTLKSHLDISSTLLDADSFENRTLHDFERQSEGTANFKYDGLEDINSIPCRHAIGTENKSLNDEKTVDVNKPILVGVCEDKNESENENNSEMPIVIDVSINDEYAAILSINNMSRKLCTDVSIETDRSTEAKDTSLVCLNANTTICTNAVENVDDIAGADITDKASNSRTNITNNYITIAAPKGPSNLIDGSNNCSLGDGVGINTSNSTCSSHDFTESNVTDPISRNGHKCVTDPSTENYKTDYHGQDQSDTFTSIYAEITDSLKSHQSTYDEVLDRKETVDGSVEKELLSNSKIVSDSCGNTHIDPTETFASNSCIDGQRIPETDATKNTFDRGLFSDESVFYSNEILDEKSSRTHSKITGNLIESNGDSQTLLVPVGDGRLESFSTAMAALHQQNESQVLSDDIIIDCIDKNDTRNNDEYLNKEENLMSSQCPEKVDKVEVRYVTDSDAEQEYQPLLINGPGSRGGSESSDGRKSRKDESQMNAFNYFLCLLTGKEQIRRKSQDDVIATSSGCGREDCPQSRTSTRQHWFSVPSERIGSLYSFFRVYTPVALDKEISTDTSEESADEDEPLLDYSIHLVEASYKPDSNTESTADDCYVIVKAGKKVLHKSNVQHRTRNPRFGEWFKGVDLRGSTKLTLKLISSRKDRRHNLIGKTSVVPDQLTISCLTDVELPLSTDGSLSEESIVGWIRFQYYLLPSNATSELIQEHKIPHPELAVESFIMSHHEVAKISESLPARAQCRTWNLVYSTTVHGFSLATLYKCMLAHNHSPTLLVIKDSHDKVFGAFTSSHLHISHNFYGTGESFLFSFTPEYQKYKWTAVDHHIVKGDVTSLSIGISGGAHGLWLDGDLYRGRSERCRTFDNQPLASEVDFIVSSLEAWSFE